MLAASGGGGGGPESEGLDFSRGAERRAGHPRDGLAQKTTGATRGRIDACQFERRTRHDCGARRTPDAPAAGYETTAARGAGGFPAAAKRRPDLRPDRRDARCADRNGKDTNAAGTVPTAGSAGRKVEWSSATTCLSLR